MRYIYIIMLPTHYIIRFYTLQLKDLWKEGTINQKTKCWAQGMEGWRTIEDIAQLKWTLVAEGIPLMNESDIAVLVLNMLIR